MIRPKSTLNYNGYQVAVLLRLMKLHELADTETVAIRTDCKDFAPKGAKFQFRNGGYAGSGMYAVAPAGAWKVWYADWETATR